MPSVKQVVTLLCLVATSSAAQPAMDLAGFYARHDVARSPFDHPQVECVLEHFLPADALEILRSRAPSLHLPRGRVDADGGVLFAVELRGFPFYCEAAVAWVHPDGRAMAGTVQCDTFMQAWANDPRLASDLPASVGDWLATLVQPLSAADLRWEVTPARPPAPCLGDAGRRALCRAEQRLEGRLCDAASPFDEPALVVAPSGRAPLSRPGAECRARGRRRYLVAGDVVSLGFASQGCRCVQFVRSGIATAGWIDDDELSNFREVAADASRQRAEIEAFAASLPPPDELAGRFEKACASVAIVDDGEGPRLVLEGGVSDGSPTLEGPLVGGGRVFDAGASGAADECGVHLVRLNNAVVVFAAEGCDQPHCSFSGIYRSLAPRTPGLSFAR